MDDIRKEELRNQRLAAMKKGREARAANIAARKVAASAASGATSQETPTATIGSIQTTTPQQQDPPQRVKRPLSDLFGRHPKKGAIPPPTPNVQPPAVKKEKAPSDFSDFNEKLRRSWVFLLGGGILALIGVGILFAGNASKNPIIIAIGAAMSGGGGYLFYVGIDRYNIRAVGKKGNVKKTANSFTITEHGATFENVANPLGMDWKWLNDGKYYHVHLKGYDGNGGIQEFNLPDNNPEDLYFSPAEAINCIRMPMNEKYLNYASSLAPKFSVIVLGIIIGAEIIGLVAIG